MSRAFGKGKVAVITGAASGIGRAAALRATAAGMKIVLVDSNATKLASTASALAELAGDADIMAKIVDVASAEAMTALAAEVEAKFGTPSLLMNNAAAFVAGGAGGILDPNENWQRLFAVNVLGIVNGVQAFLPKMLVAARPAVIVNTGSKQGLTNPPGNPAYNTSKAAVNAYTQNLARDLRDRPGHSVTAHLLIPGWTTTGDAEHRPGAWLPEQVIDFMSDAIEKDDFFILCPDGETTPAIDHKRIYWNTMDLILGRPALSRWHANFKDDYAEFVRSDLPD